MRRLSAVAILVVVFGACGGGEDAATSVTTDPNLGNGGRTVVEISINDFAFEPAEVTVGEDTQVTWTNEEGVPHTVTAQDGPWAGESSGRLATGATYTFNMDVAGTFTYFCSIHPSMTGTIIVSG